MKIPLKNTNNFTKVSKIKSKTWGNHIWANFYQSASSATTWALYYKANLQKSIWTQVSGPTRAL